MNFANSLSPCFNIARSGRAQIMKMERKESQNLYKFRKIPLELAQRQEFPSLQQNLQQIVRQS